jgi:hypothetical protein
MAPFNCMHLGRQQRIRVLAVRLVLDCFVWGAMGLLGCLDAVLGVPRYHGTMQASCWPFELDLRQHEWSRTATLRRDS